jgi:RNA polymerase sigma factor (sigma-70 family)
VDDRDLVEAVVRGEDAATRELLERYRGLFHHTISSFEANRSRRDDCFQNLTVHTLELLRRGRYQAAKGPFGPWLYRVLWCRGIDVIRKKEAKRRVRLIPVGEAPPDRPAEEEDPSEATARRELLGIVNGVFEEMGALDREVLRMRVVDGQTHERVASSLGITLDQAKYRAKKSVASFRRALLLRLGEAPV